jgi:FkbM family methyltransferase
VSHPFVFRPDTADEEVFQAINLHDEYRLPDTFAGDDVIIDIGMHIGSFCYAALRRGSNRVYGFEASPENFAQAKSNLKSFGGRVQLVHGAVWRSDQKVERLSFWDCPGNNGGGQVWRNLHGPALAVLPFDDLVRHVTRNGRDRVRLVKIDCEGSEYPILLTSKTLHLVDAIAGEFHEFGPDDQPHAGLPELLRVPGHDRYTMKVLEHALKHAGFDVSVAYNPAYPREPIGWWWATRNGRDTMAAPALSRWARLRRKVRSLTG